MWSCPIAGSYSFTALVTGQPRRLSSTLGVDFACADAKPKISVPNNKGPVKSRHWLWDTTAEHTEERTTELDDEWTGHQTVPEFVKLDSFIWKSVSQLGVLDSWGSVSALSSFFHLIIYCQKYSHCIVYMLSPTVSGYRNKLMILAIIEQ